MLLQSVLQDLLRRVHFPAPLGPHRVGVVSVGVNMEGLGLKKVQSEVEYSSALIMVGPQKFLNVL